VVGVVVGIVMGVMVVGAAVGVIAEVARSAKAALGISLLVHVFLIWLCFLEGR
jgi:hypothetical protein